LKDPELGKRISVERFWPLPKKKNLEQEKSPEDMDKSKVIHTVPAATGARSTCRSGGILLREEQQRGKQCMESREAE